MSNHDGGRMLNAVLELTMKNGMFDSLSKEKQREFVLKIVKIGNGHDCNSGEVLEDLCEKLNICYCCLKETSELDDGLCKECAG